VTSDLGFTLGGPRYQCMVIEMCSISEHFKAKTIHAFPSTKSVFGSDIYKYKHRNEKYNHNFNLKNQSRAPLKNSLEIWAPCLNVIIKKRFKLGFK
jgi:hypothetical protein